MKYIYVLTYIYFKTEHRISSNGGIILLCFGDTLSLHLFPNRWTLCLYYPTWSSWATKIWQNISSKMDLELLNHIHIFEFSIFLNGSKLLIGITSRKNSSLCCLCHFNFLPLLQRVWIHCKCKHLFYQVLSLSIPNSEFTVTVTGHFAADIDQLWKKGTTPFLVYTWYSLE